MHLEDSAYTTISSFYHISYVYVCTDGPREHPFRFTVGFMQPDDTIPYVVSSNVTFVVS